ncbi:imm11 family protein [Testudinibacter aquarius]|nr:DUF1629 domain-containing protein [Testudinibacter aquarius]
MADYLDNDCNWALCSAKMRDVIEKHANNSSEITWIPVKARDGETITPYYAILIEKAFEENVAVNYEKSRKLRDGEIYSPHFNYDVVKDKDIFTLEDYPSYVFISEKLKDILEKSGVTGVGFGNWHAS